MSDAMLFAHISSLPEDLKSEVADFVAFLEQKRKLHSENTERKFGALKGMFKMSLDFDEPMEDFKDYM